MNGDGINPNGGLVRDASGNLYGTTEFGGSYAGCVSFGCGIFFRISPAGTETILHTFGGFPGDDGSLPAADLMIDRKGTIYGTTLTGGNSNDCGMAGCGAIFSYTMGGTFNTVFAFPGGANGEQPAGGVVEDKKGNLYGTTSGSAVTNDCQIGCGTIYEVSAGGTESVLAAFDGGKDWLDPTGDLVMSASGRPVRHIGGQPGACGRNSVQDQALRIRGNRRQDTQVRRRRRVTSRAMAIHILSPDSKGAHS